MPPAGWSAHPVRAGRGCASAALIALVLLLLAPPGGGSLHPAGVWWAPHSASSAPRLEPVAPARGLTPGAQTGTFFVNTTQLQSVSLFHRPCVRFSGATYCFSGQTSPNVLDLPNGEVALLYQTYSTATSLSCAGAPNQTVSRLGIAWSTDSGTTFGSARYVGGSSTAVCPYFQQIEPAFTVDGAGHVVGAYIGADAASSYILPPNLAYAGAINGYGARPSDALIFLRSTDNGSTFSNGTILAGGGNLARPAVAAFGQTIYVAYENISNGSKPLPGSAAVGANASYPVSIHLLVSPDDGATWKGPYTLPGENVSDSNSTFSPSLAVNATGALAVAYATNRTCLAYCAATFSSVSGEDIVTTLSTTNGSRWSPLRTVAQRVAEPGNGGSSSALGVEFYYVWEFAPTTSVQFGALPGEEFVAWNGAFNLSTRSYCYYFAYSCDYADSEVFSSTSTDGGVSWATIRASPAATYATEDDPGNSAFVAYYAPKLAVRAGTVYLSFVERNYTSPSSVPGFSDHCAYLFPHLGQSPVDSYSSWLVESGSGVAWGYPRLLSNEPGSGGDGQYEYPGTAGSIGFDATGAPIVAQTLPLGFPFNPVLESVQTNISVARPNLVVPTVNLTIAEAGTTPGTRWGVIVDGNPFTSTSNNLTIANVPRNVAELVEPAMADPKLGYEILREAAVAPGILWFTGAQSRVSFRTITLAGFNLQVQPPDVPYLNFYLEAANVTSGVRLAEFNSTTVTRAYGGQVLYSLEGCPGPWYLPLGASFTVNSGSSGGGVLGGYLDSLHAPWVGEGNGSYTGPGPRLPITMGSAINETYTMLPNASATAVTFAAPALPVGTNFSVEVNGTTYSAAAGSNLTVGGLGWGTHWLANVTAASNQSGWAYFGESSAGNPILVPDNPVVNLSFAYVNLARPAGSVHLHAQNLTPGTVWQLAFNGTIYSSSTPWINVSARPGTYPMEAFPVASSSAADASYAPLGALNSISVRPGATYAVSYVPAFGVRLLASLGGSLSSSGTFWERPGAQLSVSATPAPGFAWGGWTGVGRGSYSGTNRSAAIDALAPIVESASFLPLPENRFNLTFNETGIPNGTLWTVEVDGFGYSSATPTLLVPELYSCQLDPMAGTYALTVPYSYNNGTTNLTRYTPSPYAGHVCGGSSVALRFAPEFHLELTSTTGGAVSASAGALYVTGPGWFPANGTVGLAAMPNTGYRFLGWNGTGLGSYTGTARDPPIVMAGPLTEVAAFEPEVQPAPKLVWLELVPRTAFVPGTSWSVTVGSTAYASDAGPLNITGLVAGQSYRLLVSQAVSPDGLVRYDPTSSSLPYRAENNSTQPIDFSGSAFVRVTSIGPGVATPGAAWYPLGSEVRLNATANGSAVFLGWVGTGPGNYTGSQAVQEVNVTGAFGEVAEFRSGPPGTVHLASPWASPWTMIGLGAAGLAAGLAVGWVALRRPRWPARRDGGGPPATEPVWDGASGEADLPGGSSR